MLRAALSLPKPDAKFSKYRSIVRQCIESMATESMKADADEATELNEEETDISIAFEGSLQKRGHTSKNSCAMVTSFDIGKVLVHEFCCGCTGANTKYKANNQDKCVIMKG